MVSKDLSESPGAALATLPLHITEESRRRNAMRTRAAILTGYGQDWEVTDVELDEPREREVLLRVVAAGLCHSDEQFRTGDIPRRPPAGGGAPGDTGVVYGIGGGGINAVQGARHAGAMHIVAVDPVELKRETALAL